MSIARRPVVSLPLIAVLMSFVVLAMIAFPSRAASVSTERLSTHPEIRLDDGVCHVRGAVWLDGKGPIANEELALVDRDGNINSIVKTDRRGIYEVSIALPDGKGLVLMEKDHKPSNRRSSRWSRGATIVCAKPSVDVGTVQQLVSGVMDSPK